MPQDHTVRQGETLLGILKAVCEFSDEEIVRKKLVELNTRLNGLASSDSIRIGQRLKIFCSEPESPPVESDAEPTADTTEEAVTDCFERCYTRYLRLSSRFRRSLSAELAPLTPGAWSANRDDTWPACGRSRSEHGGPGPAVRQVACTQVRPRSSQLLSKRPYRGAHG